MLVTSFGCFGIWNHMSNFFCLGFLVAKYWFLVCNNFDIVDRHIIDRLPMTKHFGRSFSILLHFNWFKNVIGTPFQALKIIFEMQSKRTS
jgi:hypothetical protein